MILIYLCLEMTWNDALKILFGTFLGFIVSLGQNWISLLRDRKKTIGLLQMQIGNVVETLERWESFNNGIPDQDLPQLHYLSANEYASLPLPLRRIAYDLDNSLRVAEGLRIKANTYISNQSSPEFAMYRITYRAWQTAAYRKAIALRNELNKLMRSKSI
jgi:hypothetical protein